MGFGLLLKEYLEKEGKSVYRLSKETGIPKTTIYGMIKRDSTPNMSIMLTIVDKMDSMTPSMLDEFLPMPFGDIANLIWRLHTGRKI